MTRTTPLIAALLAGFHAMGTDLPIMGISVRQPRERQVGAVHRLTQATLEMLGTAPMPVEGTIVDDGYVGQGYGIPAPSTLEAISLVARMEGILLDPVYTAKGMAGMIGLVRQGFFKASDRVLFLHTGGAVALSAYEDDINRFAT